MLAPQVRDRVGEMPHGNRLDPGQSRLGRRARGAEHPRQAGLECGLCQRKDSADRPQSPVQSQLADGRVLRKRVPRNLPRRGQNRECDRQVERRALLPQRGGREVDRDPPERPLQLGRGDPAPDAMLGLLARAVRETDDREPGHAVLQVRLDLDATGLESDKRMRESAREHPLHARHQTLTCLAAELCRNRKLVGIALAGDDHVLEELARPAARAAIDVAAVPSLDREPRAVEDVRVELAAVVDHDHDARAAQKRALARSRRRPRSRPRTRRSPSRSPHARPRPARARDDRPGSAARTRTGAARGSRSGPGTAGT